MEPLAFRCTGCGNCCRSLRVAVTAADVGRLVSATSRQPGELVEWLAPDAVDVSGEPDSWVELSGGRRLMVLSQRAGACLLLDAQDRCSAYAARPLDCRAYPFDFAPVAPPASPRRLQLLPLDGCDYGRDGEQERAALEAVDRARWSELFAYQERVATWNQQARRRRRFGYRVGAADAFLAFALG